MRIFNTFTLLSLVAHCWIGMWGVLTDYVTTRLMGAKATAIRMILQLGIIGTLLIVLVLGIDIFWGL